MCPCIHPLSICIPLIHECVPASWRKWGSLQGSYQHISSNRMARWRDQMKGIGRFLRMYCSEYTSQNSLCHQPHSLSVHAMVCMINHNDGIRLYFFLHKICCTVVGVLFVYDWQVKSPQDGGGIKALQFGDLLKNTLGYIIWNSICVNFIYSLFHFCFSHFANTPL